jgi:hypothetical protein
MIRPLANASDQEIRVSTTVDANAGDENVRIVLEPPVKDRSPDAPQKKPQPAKEAGRESWSLQVPEAIERGMVLDAHQQRERWPAPPPVEQPEGGTWSLQVPEEIERGMMMDRVHPRVPRQPLQR